MWGGEAGVEKWGREGGRGRVHPHRDRSAVCYTDLVQFHGLSIGYGTAMITSFLLYRLCVLNLLDDIDAYLLTSLGLGLRLERGGE